VKAPIFKEFNEHFYSLRTTGTPVEQAYAKVFLTNLYGLMTQDCPKREFTKKYSMNETGEFFGKIKELEEKKSKYLAQRVDERWQITYSVNMPLKFHRPRYFGAFILAHSRANMFAILNKFGVFDGTNKQLLHYKIDSVLFLKDGEVDMSHCIGEGLNKCKVEYGNIDGVNVVSSRKYCLRNEAGECKIRGTDRALTWQEFNSSVIVDSGFLF
jgi:hypothetical protein